jgi:hypothetical protein
MNERVKLLSTDNATIAHLNDLVTERTNERTDTYMRIYVQRIRIEVRASV